MPKICIDCKKITITGDVWVSASPRLIKRLKTNGAKRTLCPKCRRANERGGDISGHW